MQDVTLVTKLWRVRLSLSLLLAILGVFVLALASISVSAWVTLGHDNFTITGGLLNCTDCPGDLQGKWYRDAVNSNLCSPVKEGMEGLCELLADLGLAGVLFIVGQVVAIMGLGAWFGLIIAKILKVYHRNWALISVSGAVVCLQSSSLIIWITVSKAVYSDCTNLQFDNKRPQVCISTGPSLALTAALLSPLIFAVMIFAWYRCPLKQPSSDVSTTAIRFTFGNISDLSDRQV